MDFNEPDLEDLIQSDLHTEMNKILDQSESEDLPAVSKTNILDPDNTITSKRNIIQSKVDNNRSMTTSLENTKPLDSAKIKQSSKENPGLLLQVNSSKPDNFQVKSEPNESTYSGHFSLEKVPALVEELKKEPLQATVIEPGDLSNLAWLTGLDVQQTLQQNDLLESNSHFSESSVIVNPSSLPVTGACALESTNVAAECISVNSQTESMRQTIKKQSMRYAPIQPNIHFEDCQRYQLHPGDPIHRKLYPGDHVPDHRYGIHRGFHPYPPPPYGSAGGVYMPDSYHHGRLHSQGKKVFPKPVYSYSCLIAMSLRASKTGCLPVSDIYNFMMENFPYFKTAPDGWKNSVRHNLSLNKCFEKVEKPNGSQRKGCLWALNPAKISKMEEEVQKWKRKDPEAIRRSMSNPEELDRELEEIRRADEEATRRRMLSLNTHGLSMLTPSPGYHSYVRPSNPHQPHPNLHPSGTTSLPTTPQHYQHRTPQRQPMMQNHSLSSGQVAISNPMDDHGRTGHPPRQLFNYPASEQQGFSYGVTRVNNTSNSGLDPDASGHQDFQMITSYSSNSSSGGSSLLSTLTDAFSKSAHEIHDIDLDSSLAELSTFQGGLWDETDSALLSHSLVNDIDPFDEGTTQQNTHIPNIASSSVSAIEQCPTSEEPPSEPNVYVAQSHFRGDMPYLNGSNSKAVVH